MNKNQKTVIAIIIFMLMVVGLWAWRMMTPPTMTKEAMREQGVFLFDLPRAVPDIALQEMTGQPFNNDSLEGKWTFIFFGFARCMDICPTTLAELNKIAQELSVQHENPINTVFITVDPQNDTPEILTKYVASFNKDFMGVTGATQKEIVDLAATLNLIVEMPSEDAHEHHDHADTGKHTETSNTEIDHSGEIAIIDPAGNYHGFIRGPLSAEHVLPLIPSIMATF